MSVRQMTTDAIRNDLRAAALTWPDGLPWQQVDRVNALKGELKRRNEPLEAPAGTVESALATNGTLDALSTDELQTELLKLSVRNDDASKERFANIRYEIRRRTKTDEPPPAPQVAPRALELPSDDEVPERVVPRRPAVPAPRAQVKPLEKKAPTTVCGFTATGREDGSVVLEYEARADTGSVLIARVLENEDASDFIAMVAAARIRAARMSTGE